MPELKKVGEVMNDEQDREQEGIVGWIVGIAAFVAVAVALWMGLMAAFENQPKPAVLAAPEVKPAAPQAAAPAAPPMAKPNKVSLFFDVNKITPPAEAAQKLDALVDYGRANTNAKIAISGFADKTGDPAKNAELAKERAQAVRNQLISAGMPEDRIMLQKPEDITGDQTNDSGARRVDVFVVQ
jgi:outer membrane protein OmpA-like peptidoglycan-associated protein